MYAASVGGKALIFDVLGVWRRNMIIQDRQTGSIWQQATGECIAGRLKGSRLEPVGGTITTWGGWLESHPEALVAVESPGDWGGIFSKATLKRMLRIANVLETPGLAPTDRRLPMHEEVAGLVVAGEPRAYPISDLRAVPEVVESIGGIEVRLWYEASKDRVHAQVGGEAVSVQRQWWLGWSEFHQGSTVWRRVSS